MPRDLGNVGLPQLAAAVEAPCAEVSRSTSYRAAWAVEIATATPLRYTDYPGGLTVGGNAYAARDLEVQHLDLANGLPAQHIVIANLDNALSAADLTEGLAGLAVVVYEILWSADDEQLDAVERFAGIVTSLVADETSAMLKCASSSLTASGMIGRVARKHCSHVFRGARCGYSGTASWCDHTIQRCKQLGNSTRWAGLTALAPYRGQIFLWQVAAGAATPGVAVITPPPAPEPPPPPTPAVRAPRRVLRSTPSRPGTRVIRRK